MFNKFIILNVTACGRHPMDEIKQEKTRLLVAGFFICVLIFLSSCLIACSPQEKAYQGYAEGRFRYIAANNAGVLEKLQVERGAIVKAGDPLFILDPLPENALFEQAEAQVKQAEKNLEQQQANLELAELTYRRQEKLLKQHATNEQDRDEARSDYLVAKAKQDDAQANLSAARANLAQATWSKAQKRVAAPVDSVVYDTYFLEGEIVPANQPVLSLLAKKDIKIIFFIPERNLSRIKYKDRLQVTCDGCPDHLTANVSYISPTAEYTPPVIYSNSTRDKLIFRIEALPDDNAGYTFHPGQPVAVTFLSSEK